MRRFVELLGITADTRVLDIGGTPDCWALAPVVPRLVMLNTPRARGDLAGAEGWVAGDGRQLPFRDGAFDVVFSNSVIEHVGSAESQLRFAQEVARVGGAFWVQTPNRRFPVEQHLLTPFLHWLPKSWQRRLVPWSVWSLATRVSADRRRFYLDHYLQDIRLLDGGQVRDLFPGSRILRERFLGLTKSWIAFRSGAGFIPRGASAPPL
jgi:SAM-dependent methyltransferase